jgi:hypothetical protein
MMVLFGAVTGQRRWAVIGATVIVLLCILQIALNFVYLVLLPFDGSLKKALQFFLPPYKRHQRRQVASAVVAIVTPAIPVLGVILLFSFVPGLSKGVAGEDATIKERIGAEVDVLRQDMKGTLKEGAEAVTEGVEKAKSAAQEIDVDGLKNRARQGADNLMKSAQERLGSQGQPADSESDTTQTTNKQN